MNIPTTSFLTDNYELKMLDTFIKSGMADKNSVFEVFTRKLPKGRKYGIVGGTQRLLDNIQKFTFTEEQLIYLKDNSVVSDETLKFLKNFKFTGKIVGYQEGDVYFPFSPVITVEGKLGECVILETLILSVLNHDSAIASATARMVQEAFDKPLIEMGSRRTHEISAIDVARISYITGFESTSNVQAGLTYGIPTVGTMAHAFILTYPTEKKAFEAEFENHGSKTVALVDTYDTEQGIKNAIEVFGIDLHGIRIDSGDLIHETFKARKLLDSLGAMNTKIYISSDVDEFSIHDFRAQKAPVDAFGVGTRVVTGSGHPTASMVYKLVAIEDENNNMKPVHKNSVGKKSQGGKKSSYKIFDNKGFFQEEIITQEELTKNQKNDSSQLELFKNGEILSKKSLSELREFHKNVMNKVHLTLKEI